MANLWTEFTARRGDALIANGKKPQNPNKLVVAATCEMAKTLAFCRTYDLGATGRRFESSRPTTY
jgi:hypothetical protein